MILRRTDTGPDAHRLANQPCVEEGCRRTTGRHRQPPEPSHHRFEVFGTQARQEPRQEPQLLLLQPRRPDRLEHRDQPDRSFVGIPASHLPVRDIDCIRCPANNRLRHLRFRASPQAQFQLFIPGQRRRLDSHRPDIRRELSGKSVQRVNALRRDPTNHLQQIRVVRVIAQRKCRIDLILIPATGIHRPSGHHRDPDPSQFPPEIRHPLSRRTQHHMSRGFRWHQRPVRRKLTSQLRVDPRQLRHRIRQHHGQPRPQQRRQHLLRLPQRISQQDRHLPIGQCFPTESQDPVEHLLRRRQDIVRPTERRLHHQDICPTRLAHLRGQTRPQLEIPRVQQRPRLIFQQRHRRSQDMPRRQQRQATFAGPAKPFLPQIHPFPITQHVFRPFSSHPRPHQATRRLGQDHLRMRCRMIRVRMTDEHRLTGSDRVMRVQPHPPSRQMQPAPHILESRPRHAPSLPHLHPHVPYATSDCTRTLP